MFDFGIESASKFGPLFDYGPVWLVQFRDWTQVVVIEDLRASPEGNYILEELRDEKL